MTARHGILIAILSLLAGLAAGIVIGNRRIPRDVEGPREARRPTPQQPTTVDEPANSTPEAPAAAEKPATAPPVPRKEDKKEEKKEDPFEKLDSIRKRINPTGESSRDTWEYVVGSLSRFETDFVLGAIGRRPEEKTAEIEGLFAKWAKEDSKQIRASTPQQHLDREDELRRALSEDQAQRVHDARVADLPGHWATACKQAMDSAKLEPEERERLLPTFSDGVNRPVPPLMLMPDAHGFGSLGLREEACNRLRPHLTQLQLSRLEKNWKSMYDFPKD